MKSPGEKSKFGVAGFPPAFFESSFGKKRANLFEWLNSLTLDWVELQNTYGVKMKSEQAVEYRALAHKYGIEISIHAPYYITLASGDSEVVKRSVERVFQCFRLADTIGSNRIIFHPGHFGGTNLEDRKRGITQLIRILNEIKSDVPEGIYLYAETAGKKSQIGSVEEIVEICENVSFVKPCLDLAHVHGFRDGTLDSVEGILNVLNYVEQSLGRNALCEAHFHMYPVEIDKNGEKRHRAFHERPATHQMNFLGGEDEAMFFPRAEHFVMAIKEKGLSPVVICEALNSQEQGAQIMKELYYQGIEMKK